jgi:uncharacterized repeat protein (TIGR01451 family)
MSIEPTRIASPQAFAIRGANTIEPHASLTGGPVSASGAAQRSGQAAHAATAMHIALTFLVMLACSGVAMAAAPVIIYNNIPTPLPPNVASEGFQSDHTSEFGELIQFAGTDRALQTVNVVMSDFALASDYTGANSANCPVFSACTAAGWMHPISLNLYNVDNSGATPVPGTLIGTRTQTFAIPWRPEADPTCADPSRWRASDGNCYSGLAFAIAFDFSGMGITLPNQIIYGVAYNTETFGSTPLVVSGPYISLNLGLNTSTGPAPLGPPSVGSNPGNPDVAYQNQNSGGFNPMTGFAPFSVAASFQTADADLAITKSGPATVTAGTNITYTVTVTNNGLSDAQTVALTDNTPANSTFVSESQTSGPAFSCTNPAVGGTGPVSCTLATLASGASASFTLVFNVSAAVPNGTTITNTASVASSTPDSVPANNSATSTAISVITAAAIPALSPLALLFLALALSLAGLIRFR